VLARAWLDRGDAATAARHAAAAVQAAQALAYTYPLAACLETAALVCLADGHGADAGRDDAAGARTAAMLLEVAARIRARGDRPGIPALRTAVEAARASGVRPGRCRNPSLRRHWRSPPWERDPARCRCSPTVRDRCRAATAQSIAE
jgi:hypothetical protein